MAILAPTTQNAARTLWLPSDDIWHVAARFFLQSGFGSYSDFVEAIAAANAQVQDWSRIAPGSTILVPLASNRST